MEIYRVTITSLGNPDFTIIYDCGSLVAAENLAKNLSETLKYSTDDKKIEISCLELDPNDGIYKQKMTLSRQILKNNDKLQRL